MKRHNFISLISIIFILLAGMAMVGCATPLINAVERGDIDEVKKLLETGADPNASADMSPLNIAASRGDINMVRILLDKGANLHAGVFPPIRFAVKGSNYEVVKLLLDKGADPNSSGTFGCGYEQLLVEAAGMIGKGSIKIVDLLIERGANFDVALSYCERHSSDFMCGSNYAKCYATLKQIKTKRDEIARQEEKEQKLTKAKEIEANKAKEMKEIIKEVVAETAKTQKQAARPSSVQSDIEKPSFTPAEKIISDNDLAVIIGIEGYQSLPKSDYSYDDAKLVKDYIKALGFKERNIELITDEKATLSSITKTLEAWLKNKAKNDSKVFVYYSGHGSPDPATGEAYLVPYDGDPNYLAVTGYPLKRLYDNLGKLQVAEVTVVLDACFSGAGGRSVLAQGARPLVMVADIKTIPSNMAILSATQGSQISTSSSEKGHGVFTYYFLKALKGGKKTIAEIYEYIKPLVEDDAKQLNVQQSPSISPDVEKLKGRFELRK
ncbi:MAG: polysaccharide deacetylase [Nitrospirae bacterium]|nr:MAG: polysaccharide deacetylase [Nitrospirota bacterium]